MNRTPQLYPLVSDAPCALRPLLLTLILAVTTLASPSVLSAYTQQIVTGTVGVFEPTLIDRPGGFISSLSGLATGGNPDPGFDPATAFAFTPHIVENFFVGGGAAAATSMYPPSMPNPTSESTSNGSARLGRTSFAGRAQQVFDPMVGQAVTTIAHGGWVDTVTVTSANPLLNGTQAIWLFKVNVSSTFDVSGFNGFGAVELEPYINQLRLPASAPGYDDGQFNHPISTDRQHAQWQLGVPFIGATAHTGFVDTATFAAQITLGTPFDLGIFALGWAVAGTNSGFQSVGSDGEFGGTVTWGGSAGLTGTNGVSLGAFEVTSLSGTNWVQPIPIPGLAWLVAVSAMCSARCRRRTDPLSVLTHSGSNCRSERV